MLTRKPLHIVGMGGTLSRHSRSLHALQHALGAAENAGATTDLIALREINLPMYQPELGLGDYEAAVRDFIDRVREADAMIWSTGAYHGSLPGVMKNAIDFMQFLADDATPYLDKKVIGLIATAGGDIAAINTTNAMVNIVHALRGTVPSLSVAIPHAGRVFNADGSIKDAKWAKRLEMLGGLVVEMAGRWQMDAALLGEVS